METIRFELQEGMKLAKCRQCGCMAETLEMLRSSLRAGETNAAPDLLGEVEGWQAQMEAIRYACLGCARCYPAVAANFYHEAFPAAAETQAPACAFEVRAEAWPPVPGEYFAFCDGATCPVAVSTLASTELSERLARRRPEGLCIVGKTETENIGIDKIVKNTVANPTIRYLLLAGKEPGGHASGRTLLALKENGVDDGMRVIGSPGKRPLLRNVTQEEVDTFRKQVQVVDLIGCEDEGTIVEKIGELARAHPPSYGCGGACGESVQSLARPAAPVVQARPPVKIEMDKAGYYVILPRLAQRNIIVEHYAYDNSLLRVIEGHDARSIYWTIIENGWVTQLSHAAYLGKELAKAELSLSMGADYVQDGA